MKVIYVGDISNVCYYMDTNDDNSKIIESGIKWKVSNTKLATIDKDGVITAKKEGSITVTGTYKGYKATKKITIESKQINFKDLYIPLNRAEQFSVRGGENIIKSIVSSNNDCLEIEDAQDSSYVEVQGKSKGTTKVTLITEYNKVYTSNVTVIDPLELTITKVKIRTEKGMAVLDFTLRNDSKHAISTSNKIGALGEEYGLSVRYMKSDAVIQPGKSKTLTILSELPVKDYGKDILKEMTVGLNVKYEGQVFGVWFDSDNKKINYVFFSGFTMESIFD